MNNAESYSWLPCSLVNSNNCESVKTIHDAYVAAAAAAAAVPASAVWHATSTQQTIYTSAGSSRTIYTSAGLSIEMSIPSNFHLTVRLFKDEHCTMEIPNTVRTSSDTQRKLVWSSSGTEYFKIDIPFSSRNQCSCGPEAGGTGDSKFSIECVRTPCRDGERLQKIENPCNFDFKKCVWCPRHHQKYTSETCSRCPDTTPHREEQEDRCRACEDNEYFFMRTPSLESQGCKELTSMTVDVDGKIKQYQDEYRTGTFEKQTLTLGSFRRSFDSIAACDEASRSTCNESGAYLHACIGEIPDNKEFYVQTKTDDIVQTVHYNEAFSLPATQYTQVDVWRQGQCKPCTQCTHGQYLYGCVSTDSDYRIFPGVGWLTHDENKGSCRSCGNEDTLHDDEYFWHPQPGNCTQWSEGEISSVPFQTKQCKMVLISKNNDRVLLNAGCNKQSFTWWTTERVTSSRDSTPRSVPGSRTCHRNGGDSECELPDVVGQNTPSTQVTWSAYSQADNRLSPPTTDISLNEGGGTARVAYCPPGWYVDLECATEQGTTTSLTWSAECCRECTECRAEQLLKRSQHWVACDGSTTVDTQSFCQASCDVGYYENKVIDADSDYSTCTPCELC